MAMSVYDPTSLVCQGEVLGWPSDKTLWRARTCHTEPGTHWHSTAASKGSD